jgi:hypothetical protein
MVASHTRCTLTFGRGNLATRLSEGANSERVATSQQILKLVVEIHVATGAFRKAGVLEPLTTR